jgi:hypothetical protein
MGHFVGFRIALHGISITIEGRQCFDAYQASRSAPTADALFANEPSVTIASLRPHSPGARRAIVEWPASTPTSPVDKK